MIILFMYIISVIFFTHSSYKQAVIGFIPPYQNTYHTIPKQSMTNGFWSNFWKFRRNFSRLACNFHFWDHMIFLLLHHHHNHYH